MDFGRILSDVLATTLAAGQRLEEVVGRREATVVVTDLEPYCVVVEKYDEHATVLKQSVATWERQGHRFFLMKDDLAVREAVERGATPVGETDFVVGL